MSERVAGRTPWCQESGERAWTETAKREVREETGYEVEGLSQFAVVLLHQEGERADDYTYPYPDCFWVVYTATATSRPSGEWADTEGWETASELHAIADAMELDLSPVDKELLRALTADRL